jgi:hypothetical protein
MTAFLLLSPLLSDLLSCGLDVKFTLRLRLCDCIAALEGFHHVAAALALEAFQVNLAISLFVDFDGDRLLLHASHLLQRTANRS